MNKETLIQLKEAFADELGTGAYAHVVEAFHDGEWTLRALTPDYQGHITLVLYGWMEDPVALYALRDALNRVIPPPRPASVRRGTFEPHPLDFE